MASGNRTFLILLAAGIAFIVIGAASSIYTNVAVDVPLDNTVNPGLPDIITPNMQVGNTADVIVTGSVFNVTIKDPDGTIMRSENGVSEFQHEFTAQKDGEYRIEIINTGDTDLFVSGHTQTTRGPLALTPTLMLVITGIIVIGISLRFRRR